MVKDHTTRIRVIISIAAVLFALAIGAGVSYITCMFIASDPANEAQIVSETNAPIE